MGIFLLTTVSRAALGPTQPPIQQVPVGTISLGVNRLGRVADPSPHLAPRSEMHAATLPLLCTP
jgi:hypothetical protein